jgi:hypothetical protein
VFERLGWFSENLNEFNFLETALILPLFFGFCSRFASLMSAVMASLLLSFVGRVSGGKAKRLPTRRSKGGRGDAVAFCQREPTTAPTPDSIARWWSICGGGAVRFRKTKTAHHRRKRGAGA